MQNAFIIKAKVNNNNVKQETHRRKQVIYVAIISEIVAYTNNYKQKILIVQHNIDDFALL